MHTLSDFNLQKINTKEFADNLAATIEFGGNLLAVAQRGSGKTSIGRETIKRLNHKEVYFNLSTFERVDFSGFPDFFGNKTKTDKFVHFLLPVIFKDLIEGDIPCVAHLDEVDKADQSLLHPLLEFLQSRSINGANLKNLKAVIMTANLPSEGGERPHSTLLDRTEKYLVEILPQHWLEWGGETGEIHSTVSAFIADNPNELVGELDQGENFSEKSPRSWHNFSKILTYGEKHNWHPKMLMHKAGGCVGKQAAIKYAAFFEHYQILLPTVDKILKGEKVKEFAQLEKSKQLIICMILCSRYARTLDLCKEKCFVNNQLKEQNIILLSPEAEQMGEHLSKFLCDKVDSEISAISMRGQLGGMRLIEFNLLDDPNWDKLFSSIKNVMK